MRAGITILPEYRWAEAKPRWQAAEAYGFAHAWTFDHLGWGPLVDHTWFGAVPTLGAAASVTSRIELGFMVASPNFRHPLPFAREVITLDDLSDGRMTIGIGAGGVGGYDVRVFGGTTEAASPSRRYAEFVELLDALLTGDQVDYSGEYYNAVAARNTPGCVQRPRTPFILAANGPKGLALAARRGEGWVTLGTDRSSLDAGWASLAEVSARFDEAL
ncbi:LLM class flavin-dependent oxidoreductase, partial [Actinosynnema sp. NPDC023658]|uniref:LLM class flavin-dependent oxidoreductase n=1 Tax=Actinosynnema sp. NPDC023658 TaxID=3155465 RepID=UPI0033D1D6A3